VRNTLTTGSVITRDAQPMNSQSGKLSTLSGRVDPVRNRPDCLCRFSCGYPRRPQWICAFQTLSPISESSMWFAVQHRKKVPNRRRAFFKQLRTFHRARVGLRGPHDYCYRCRGHGVECRRMATRAPSLRMKALLVDMARGWDRLAVEAEQYTQTNEPALL
jgi:hypothetical protein